MYIILIIIIIVALTYGVLRMPAFGRFPGGARLQRIKMLPTYSKGEIRNLVHTPTFPKGVTYFDVIKVMLKRNPLKQPPAEIPHVLPDLVSTQGTKVTWFGHSSYLVQIDHLKVLVDPVFSKSTSPFERLGNTSYAGTDFIHADDFQNIDVLLITHDHYDHLDMATVIKLRDKVKQVVTSLGVGEHLERWGFAPEKITELAWDESTSIFGLSFIAAPARHFSGRTFKRGQTLWSSFILKTPQYNLFLGGDSGYESHFKKIGEEYGPFDLVILECGQYNAYWPYIHMFPEDTVRAAKDLRAATLLPVHWGKFTLALHNWDEPIRRVVVSAKEQHQPITTPLPGQTIEIGTLYPSDHWWLNVVSAKQ